MFASEFIAPNHVPDIQGLLLGGGKQLRSEKWQKRGRVHSPCHSLRGWSSPLLGEGVMRAALLLGNSI